MSVSLREIWSILCRYSNLVAFGAGLLAGVTMKKYISPTESRGDDDWDEVC